MKRVKKLIVITVALIPLVFLAYFGLPAFAQTYVATLIPGQPLNTIAAEQIIIDSGLPIEKLPDGMTNEVTRGRDAVNAYRYAHTMLYVNGWYRGISEDHTPLLVAMVGALEKEGYISKRVTWEERKTQILHDFWYASDTQNAKELGYTSLGDFYDRASKMDRQSFKSKWK